MAPSRVFYTTLLNYCSHFTLPFENVLTNDFEEIFLAGIYLLKVNNRKPRTR